MESEVVKILVEDFRNHDISSFEKFEKIYEECGLIIIPTYTKENIKLKEYEPGYFYFNIIDKQKYLLGKIKYGI